MFLRNSAGIATSSFWNWWKFSIVLISWLPICVFPSLSYMIEQKSDWNCCLVASCLVLGHCEWYHACQSDVQHLEGGPRYADSKWDVLTPRLPRRSSQVMTLFSPPRLGKVCINSDFRMPSALTMPTKHYLMTRSMYDDQAFTVRRRGVRNECCSFLTASSRWCSWNHSWKLHSITFIVALWTND